MTDRASNHHHQSSTDYKHKELLYNLFYELTSEIKGCKIEIDEDEYEENIRTINYKQLVNYVRDSIQILLRNKSEEINNLKNKISTIKTYSKPDELTQYENLLKKYEFNEKKYIKRQFQHKLQSEAMENKISEYMEMEEEFEEMKTKYKYEDGKFLNNDRKDNEIVILRGENSNLKKVINDLENKVKELEDNNNKLIKNYNNAKKENDELLVKLEEKQKELNLFSNININISNCNNNSSNNTNNNISGNNISSGLEKCPYCNNNKKIDNSSNSSPQLKICHYQKVIPNLNKKANSNKNANNNNNNVLSNTCLIKNDFHDKIKNDFMTKYFTNRHNSKNKTNLNHSSIKITRLPIGHLTNRNDSSSNSNRQIPPINNINNNNYGINSINSYKHLFNNNSNIGTNLNNNSLSNSNINTSNSRKNFNRSNSKSYRMIHYDN